MKFYFILQYRRMIRFLKELGLHPMIALVLIIIAFLGLSTYLFYKTEMAYLVYDLLMISILLRLGNQERNDSLKAIFGKSDYLRIRMLENGCLCFPFFLYLGYKQLYLPALLLVPIAIGLALIANLPKLQTTIPTPFKRIPFESIIGFRKSAWFLFLIYLLSGKALQVDNYNLGIFSLVVLFFIHMDFYSKPEEKYYCWIFAMGPTAYLGRKIKDGLIASSILTLPVFLAIIICFLGNYWITIAAQLLGYTYLISMILAKYSAFPGRLNIVHSIFYAVSILFPPLLIIIIPIFYIQAKRRLTNILGW